MDEGTCFDKLSINFSSLSIEIKKPTKKWAILTVRMKGLEPPRLAAPDPKSGAAAITPHPQI